MFIFIGNIRIKPTTTPLLRRFGFRPVLIVATAGAAATMVLAANALQATVQQLSVGRGVTVGAVVLRAGQPLARLLPGHSSESQAYTIAFILIAVVALTATLGVVRMHPDAGASVTRRPADEAAPSGWNGPPRCGSPGDRAGWDV